MDKWKIGQRIQEARKKRGYTQNKFSEMLGITPNHLSALERGIKIPSLETFIEITNLLGVSASELLIDVSKVPQNGRAIVLEDQLNDLSAEDFCIVEHIANILAKKKKKARNME